LFAFELYSVCVFFLYCIVCEFSQVIGCEDCLRNDLGYVGWDVKLFSNSSVVVVEMWSYGVLETYIKSFNGNQLMQLNL